MDILFEILRIAAGGLLIMFLWGAVLGVITLWEMRVDSRASRFTLVAFWIVTVLVVTGSLLFIAAGGLK
jgi:hypothetical protein